MPSSPIILLIRPQMGENIGAAARAMKNFGLTELRLVAPKAGWPNERAEAMASGATDILEHAKVFATTDEAVADLQVLYATTGRSRDMVKPVAIPKTAAAEIREKISAGQRVGILFGPERTGLESYEVNIADVIVNIPASPEHPSLNIAQSVVVMCYEWFGSAVSAPEKALDLGRSEPASRGELDGFFMHLEEELAAHDFFKSPSKRPGMMQNIRNFLVRAQLTDQDIRTLHGIVRALVWHGEYREKK